VSASAITLERDRLVSVINWRTFASTLGGMLNERVTDLVFVDDFFDFVMCFLKVF
jgi:hypothetical protein